MRFLAAERFVADKIADPQTYEAGQKLNRLVLWARLNKINYGYAEDCGEHNHRPQSDEIKVRLRRK